ncbi:MULTISPECIES: protein translocase subunit SecD [unclassified Coleofasciculus]|uniref:protein translocase subunit SecD n=1 Tax=unclassified Coleofasciculus TaxID=2692782 RepID=UPI001880C99E|nr:MULTISPECIES: protein translocase subunit SecD [unclassified Coleofasciculus]MBE9127848.1 protein translocase subunit SecD [Coleofasciculus sp. LEGE 07081]MBE9148092.1 protein translocase subunit SecD [Coleofasciculus sp. LEGE 07092]
MQRQRSLLALILVLVVLAIVVLIKIPIQLGLDLRGGAQLTIQVNPTEEIQEITAEQLEAVQSVIERRVNALGVSESVVQSVGSDQILVQLPGVNDPQQAERVLGGTAQLEFRMQRPGTEAQLQIEQQVRQQLLEQRDVLQKSGNEEELTEVQDTLDRSNEAIAKLFESINLTGKNLQDARAQPTQFGELWEVSIRFDAGGGEKFAQLTKDLAGTGRSIGIFLDNALLSSPTVGPEYAETGIAGGGAVITGNFTVETASELAVQLRGGALPLPVEIVENRTVGATLGRDSIQSSVYAAVGGLILVLIFMGVYYRLPGLIADAALSVYSLFTLAAFVLLGVTLTLPGIAGFILSIGMAVDANVLIFERTREELREGKTLYRSVESGFYRAFSSILDANVTTLIACAALFWLGSGLVKGFALTLAIGVAMSMFTAITCSRTLMLLLVLGFPGVRQKPELFCPNLPASVKS